MLVNLGTGNVTVVLLMGGKSSWGAINTGAALVVNIGLNLLLIPHLGILGAAIAWGASIVVDNVAAMVELRWVLGLQIFGPGYGLVMAVTVGCFGVSGIVARGLLGQTLPALGRDLGRRPRGLCGSSVHVPARRCNSLRSPQRCGHGPCLPLGTSLRMRNTQGRDACRQMRQEEHL